MKGLSETLDELQEKYTPTEKRPYNKAITAFEELILEICIKYHDGVEALEKYRKLPWKETTRTPRRIDEGHDDNMEKFLKADYYPLILELLGNELPPHSEEGLQTNQSSKFSIYQSPDEIPKQTAPDEIIEYLEKQEREANIGVDVKRWITWALSYIDNQGKLWKYIGAKHKKYVNGSDLRGMYDDIRRSFGTYIFMKIYTFYTKKQSNLIDLVKKYDPRNKRQHHDMLVMFEGTILEICIKRLDGIDSLQKYHKLSERTNIYPTTTLILPCTYMFEVEDDEDISIGEFIDSSHFDRIRDLFEKQSLIPKQEPTKPQGSSLLHPVDSELEDSELEDTIDRISSFLRELKSGKESQTL